MDKTIALVGTLDSKGEEFLFVKELIEKAGFHTLSIHCGIFEPFYQPDVTNQELAAVVDGNLDQIIVRKDRGSGTELMSKAIEKVLPQLYEEGRFDGVLSFGGSGGTAIATSGMRTLPIGVPKVMVSTVAAAKNIDEYVGVSDIAMFPSIVDVSGLNSISRIIFSNAAYAVMGMVSNDLVEPTDRKPLIAATMFGVTTPAVDYAREYLVNKGYEVLVFHATGTGGKTMESLIISGLLDGVLDLTTTEWADQLFDGILAAGPHRLEAGIQTGIPQVVSLGALDMVNFASYETVPSKYWKRNLYKHNPTTTLMRTNVDENISLAKVIASKLNQATEKIYLVLPLKGISMLDDENQAFYDPEADQQLFNTLRNEITNPLVEILELNQHINDPEFSKEVVDRLLRLMEERGKEANE